MASTWKAFRIQVRVVGALLMREVLTRYGRHNIGFMWLFVEPMIFTLGVASLWSLAGLHRKLPIPVVAFAVTGYSSVLLWRNMATRSINSLEPNLALLYHRYVKIIDLFAARMILEGIGAVISFVVLCACFIFFGVMQWPQDVPKIVLAIVLLAWFGASLALFLGCLSMRSEVIEKLWHPATYLMFPLSGAAFMVDWLPESVQRLILLLPMVHGVELLRDGYFGSSVHTHYRLDYMAGFCLVLTALGLAAERIVGRTIAPE